jgi:hypothetical protein
VHDYSKVSSLRNQPLETQRFRKEAPPAWASGKQAVNSIMLAGAVKQVADAYSSNFAKKRKNPCQKMLIRTLGLP